MNGAVALLKTASAGGIEICFANPGTTEIPLVVALDQVPGIRAVLCLFEGVCTGAADGYGRMKGSPAMSILHLGPGLANGVANLHNARRAKTPIVNLIGEHATWHKEADAPLAMDVEALASTVSGWCRTNDAARNFSLDMAEAISASRQGQTATLVAPHDHQLEEAGDTIVSMPGVAADPLNAGVIEKTANLLKCSKRPALLLGGQALLEPGLRLAARVRTFTGCDLLVENFPARVECGVGLPPLTRIPYFPEPALSMLSVYDLVVLVGTREPVTFFGYVGVNSYLLTKDQKKILIPSGNGGVTEALEYLANILESGKGSQSKAEISDKPVRPQVPIGTLTPEKVCLTLAAIQPEGAIIVDEGLTTALTYFPLTVGLPRMTCMTIVGGSIGYGMPCASGAAVACPDRPVINLQADGSAAYTVQALWTQAREGLNVTTLLCSNRSYNIVRVELERAGVTTPGPYAQSLTDLGHPAIDWVRIARGFGVPGVSVDTADDLAREIRHALADPGPHLIEMCI
ncbi:MAG: acetolactate synthase large subunit [Syntrophobacterales bacterium]|jgi:acetolactate synthase-1/2/3 large subunit|nr:acetolactate synthase large subunit [Syntrophobacterales bacterium]